MKHISYYLSLLFVLMLVVASCKTTRNDEFNVPTLDWTLDETAATELMEKEKYELTEQDQNDPSASYSYAPVATVLGDCAWTLTFENGILMLVEGEINMEGRDMKAVKEYFDNDLRYTLQDEAVTFSEDGYNAFYLMEDSVSVELNMGPSNAYVTFNNPKAHFEYVTED